ncbi:zinc finger, GRF-type containing protein [Tanacetum coccineum]
MVRCACGLEAMIRTSWANRNQSRRFYGCPILSPTCVNFLQWFDPPMCKRSVLIIPGLLRSRNELEEILVMVEEKRLKLMKFLIISWVVMGYGIVDECGFVLIDGMNRFSYQLLVYFDLKTQREVQVAAKINNLTRQLIDIIDERHSFIGELEQRLPTNVMAYKTRQELKGLQKDDMIRAMEMRLTAL